MKRKRRTLISLLVMMITISCAFTLSTTLAVFVDYMTVDANQTAFVDSVTENFICYPLVKANPSDDNAVAIGWHKKPNECTGALTIPATVKRGNGGEAVTYKVKAIAESGFRYCDFTSITFSGTDVEEIKSEAFYSCQNMTTFTMPEKCIHGIAPSCFMDCRNLTKVDMSAVVAYIDTRKGESGFLANNPFIIGDHAFSSCVKLKGFTFPANLEEIDDSAFHNCSNIFGIFLPAKNGVNTIRIGKYAFADCTNLSICHIEKNISSIDSYAFAQCDKLKIYYEGNISDANDPINTFDEYFRKKHVATNKTDATADYVPINYNISAMAMDEDHPGLVYIKQPGPIYYDGRNPSTHVLDSSTDDYITIFQWRTPSVDSDDYDAVNDILTIPDEIDGCPVKKIDVNAFNNTDPDVQNVPLKGIVFNPSLVQICHQAFRYCNQLATIDFSDCVALREIGYEAFIPSNKNTAFTGTLTLPNCLYYIGYKAFYNFTKATSLELFDASATPYLKAINGCAFQNFGSEVANQYKGTLDLILPYSLVDTAVDTTNPTYGKSASGASVGDYAFNNCPLIKYVTMQYHPTKPNNINQRTSFGVGCFKGDSYMLRFKANYASCRLGESMLEGCSSLKEVFLSTVIASKDSSNIFPWGYGEAHSIFFTAGNDATTAEFRDCVIYVDGSQAPQKSKQEKYYVWNSDPRTYQNEYASSVNTNTYTKNGSNSVAKDSIVGRLIIPTYYNVNYHTAGTIKYVTPSDGSVSNTPDDNYTNCVACLKNTKDSNKYVVTRCYKSGMSSLDMSGWSLGANVSTIGSCAFATLNAGNTTQKIILPTTIVTIRDRAFYSVGNDGINIVTYKSGGNEVEDSGSPKKTNICFLPTNVTRVEGLSFYNNDFQKVQLPNSLTFMGNTAFAVSPGKTATIESFIGSGSSSVFTYDDGGMYDTSTNTLLYYAAKGSSTTLDLSSKTIAAIGARALANTNYTSITLPSSVTTVYGGAFGSNSALTEISGLTGLEYIAAVPVGGAADVWNSDANFDIYDLPAKDFCSTYNSSNNFANRPYFYQWYDTFGSFANCSALETLDLTACKTTLKKIGYGAFEGCSSLDDLTGSSTTYTYYRYANGITKSNVSDKIDAHQLVGESLTKGVLDLSEAANMTHIGRGAFRNCSSIKYAHLPILQSQNTDKTHQASLYLGIDYSSTDKRVAGSWYNNAEKASSGRDGIFSGCAASQSGGAVLIGESAEFANPSGTKYNSTTTTIKATWGSGLDNWDENKIYIDRYPLAYLPGTNTYYYVRGESYFSDDTVASVGGTTIKYWINIGSASDHNYMLFERKEDLKTYFEIA